MNSKIFSIHILILALVLSGCQKNSDVEDLEPRANKTERSDDEYMTVRLSISGKNGMRSAEQDLRTFYHLATEVPRFSFGIDGSEVAVRTRIYTIGDNKQVSLVYNDVISWMVDAEGKELRCANLIKLPLRILDSKRIVLYATIENKQNLGRAYDKSTFFLEPLKEITSTPNIVDLDVPYALLSDLTLKHTYESMLEPVGSPTFQPLGQMFMAVINNQRSTPITLMGITTGIDAEPIEPNKVFKYATFGVGDINKEKARNLSHVFERNTIPVSGLEVSGPNYPLIWLNKRAVNRESEIETVSIGPGEQRYFVTWSPRFSDSSSISNYNFRIVCKEDPLEFETTGITLVPNIDGLCIIQYYPVI